MALLKLNMANEAGESVGTIYVNTDQILAITTGPKATELQMADGRTRWVKESSDEVASRIKPSS